MAGAAPPTNTFETFDAIGIREELSDLIANISPTDTPFLSNIGSESCENTYFEWQVDALDSAAQNHQIEGFDITTYSAVTATERWGNYTSIAAKDFVISGTEEVVNKAGRSSETGYQLMKAAKAIKRDEETNALANNAAVAGSSGTARETGGLGAWIKTNTNISATNGADPVWTSAPTGARSDGTARAFIEADLKNAWLECWNSGGDPTMLLVGGFNKQAASAFTGIAARRYMAEGDSASTIIGAADLYIGDFGRISIVPSRFGPLHYAYGVDPTMARRRVLRPYQVNEMAKTGDNIKYMVLCESGLQIDEEAAHFVVSDLTTS